MDVEVFSAEMLLNANRDATLPPHREHVTFYFWKTDMFTTHRVECETDLSDLRLTLDYQEDYTLIATVIDALYDNTKAITLTDVIEVLRANPELVASQAHIIRNAGWQSALKKDADVKQEPHNDAK